MIKVVIEEKEFELPLKLEKVKEIIEQIAIKMIEKYSNGNYKKYNYATAILDSLDYLDNETIHLNINIPSHQQLYKMIKKKKKKKIKISERD